MSDAKQLPHEDKDFEADSKADTVAIFFLLMFAVGGMILFVS